MAANSLRANLGNHAAVSRICLISSALNCRPHCTHAPASVASIREPLWPHRRPIAFPLSCQNRSVLSRRLLRKVFLASTASPCQNSPSEVMLQSCLFTMRLGPKRGAPFQRETHLKAVSVGGPGRLPDRPVPFPVPRRIWLVETGDPLRCWIRQGAPACRAPRALRSRTASGRIHRNYNKIPSSIQ